MGRFVTKNENLKKIDALAKLKPGWDGGNGIPFSANSIRAFKDVISALNIQPQIAPTNHDSLYMRFLNSMDVELSDTVANVLMAGMIEQIPANKAVDYINRMLGESIYTENNL